MNNDGRLTRDGFAVAMHLIQGKLSGKEVPTALPPSLIPPSMRAAVAPSQPPIPEAIKDLLWDDSPPASATAPTYPQSVLQPQSTGTMSVLQPQSTGMTSMSQGRPTPTMSPPPRIPSAVPQAMPSDPFASSPFGMAPPARTLCARIRTHAPANAPSSWPRQGSAWG